MNILKPLQKEWIFLLEYVAHRLAKKVYAWDEHIPTFNTRFPNKLESCLAVPFFSYSGKDMYRGLVAKSAVLFYFGWRLVMPN